MIGALGRSLEDKRSEAFSSCEQFEIWFLMVSCRFFFSQGKTYRVLFRHSWQWKFHSCPTFLPWIVCLKVVSERFQFLTGTAIIVVTFSQQWVVLESFWTLLGIIPAMQLNSTCFSRVLYLGPKIVSQRLHGKCRSCFLPLCVVCAPGREIRQLRRRFPKLPQST